MISYLKRTWEFTKNLGTTGAFTETSEYVVDAISKQVNPNKQQVIIEYGAGYGNITRGLLAKMNENSVLYAFEVNLSFCETLRQIGDKRLIVIPLSASEVDKYLTKSESVDCIISSIPFSFIPNGVLDEILQKSHHLLKTNHYMTQVLYSRFQLKRYKRYFQNCKSRIVWNIPLAFIYESQK